MGSATTQALTAARAQLGAVKSLDLATAEQVLAAGRVIGDSSSLLAALTAFETDAAPKVTLSKQLFGKALSATALKLVDELVASRWSHPDDLLVGIEDLGIRIAAQSAGKANLDEELLSFARAISTDHELELALGSKLSPTSAKVALAEKLLAGKASDATRLVVAHLVQQPRGRRVGAMLQQAAEVAADQSGYLLATVSTANPLDDKQAKRLEQNLAARYGRTIRLNVVLEPAILGGLKVQIGDDVIDGSIAARVNELRLKLVG